MEEHDKLKNKRVFHKRSEMMLVTGSGNKELARNIAATIGMELAKVEVGKFADGETCVRVEIGEEQSVRGKHVFVIQSVCRPVNDNLMELLIMIDALKRSSAAHITAVIPYYGYARQDKKVIPREPITAKLVADLLETAGVNRVMAMDLHSASIQGFFDIPVDHLSSLLTAVKYFKERGIGGNSTVVVSPDVGGVARARMVAEQIESPLAIISKRRSQANRVAVFEVIGRVGGKKCLMIDDMADTARTLTAGAGLLKKHGANEVIAYCTHGVLSGDAIDRIRTSQLKELIVTDTIPLPKKFKDEKKIKVISVAKVFGEAIQRAFEDKSISVLFFSEPKKK
jgi:ribose-phosphate pyrophosphokinase